MKYSVITFGCRVNQADSLGFEEALRQRGAVSADSPEQAELVIINTCSVTASADQAARQAVRRLARTNPDARVVVTGCSATRQPNDFRLLPNVMRVVPNDEKSRLVPLLFSDLGLTTAFRFGNGWEVVGRSSSLELPVALLLPCPFRQGARNPAATASSRRPGGDRGVWNSIRFLHRSIESWRQDSKKSH